MYNFILFFFLTLFSVCINAFNPSQLRKIVVKISYREEHSHYDESDQVLMDEIREYRAMRVDMLENMKESPSRTYTLERMNAVIEKIVIQLLRRLKLTVDDTQRLIQMIVVPGQITHDNPIFTFYTEIFDQSLLTDSLFQGIFNDISLDLLKKFQEALSQWTHSETVQQVLTCIQQQTKTQFLKRIVTIGKKCCASEEYFSRFLQILNGEEIENPSLDEQIAINTLQKYTSLCGALNSEEIDNLSLEISAQYLQSRTRIQERTPRAVDTSFVRIEPRQRMSDTDALPGLAELYHGRRMTTEENNRETANLIKQHVRYCPPSEAILYLAKIVEIHSLKETGL